MRSILQRLRHSLPLRDMAVTDRKVLLSCIGLALVFWLILNLSQEYEINKEVNLDYRVSPERVMAGSPPRQIPIQLTGRGWNLIWESVRGSSVDVTIDLADRTELLLSGNLLRQEISRQLSSGDLEVVSMGYESEQLLTTPRDGKRVPVEPRLTLQFVPGYFQPHALTILPDSVTVSGSADVLEGVTSWPTEPLTLEALKETTVTTVPLAAAPQGLTLNYQTVRVGVAVEAFIEQQLSVPITVTHAPASDSARVFPAAVTVTVTLPESEYGQYTESDFRVEADINQLQTANNQNTVPLMMTRVPESIKDVQFTPRAVEYYVYRREEP